MICRVGLVTKLFLLFCFFQVLFDTFPDNGIRFHFTACATTADLELIKERVIRAIIVHVIF